MMKNDFDMEVKKILKSAEKEMYNLNHPYVGSEHVLLSILKSKSSSCEILKKYGITYDKFRNNLIRIVGKAHKKSEIALYTPLLKRIISNAMSDAKEKNDKKVKTEHILIAMLEEGEGVGIRILINMNVDLEGLYNSLTKSVNSSGNESNLLIYEIGKLLKPNDEHVFKREEEIKNIIEILLRKNKNNPLLIGEAGVGKTAIVEELARRIRMHDVPDFLDNKKIIELDTGSLISGTRYRGDFEDRLNKIIKEVILEKDIILFIDEIHTLVNCGGAEGAIDAANILKPYLARGDLKVIGATTMKEYKDSIQKDKALDRRFQCVNISEPSLNDTEYILKHIKEYYERHHNVIITDENIKDIVKYTDKYIFNKFNPDKSIDILDSVCAHVQLERPNQKNALTTLEKKKEKMLLQKKYKEALETELKIKNLEENTDKIQITKKDILKVIEYKANTPVFDSFNAKLTNLASTLKRQVYGQDDAIDEIVDAIKSKYLLDNSKPLSILLDGASGTGKTYTSKQIANCLFGEKHYLRLDMSEFSNSMSITKLLGSSQGYVGYNDDNLFDKIKDYPYSVILLDEIDKACPEVKNIFKEIMSNGRIANNKGEIIHFENTTILITDNSVNTTSIGFGEGGCNKKELDDFYVLINRIVHFKSIDVKSAKKYIKREAENYDLNKEDIDQLIMKAEINKNGMRGIQRELNKYKISKILSKV